MLPCFWITVPSGISIIAPRYFPLLCYFASTSSILTCKLHNSLLQTTSPFTYQHGTRFSKLSLLSAQLCLPLGSALSSDIAFFWSFSTYHLSLAPPPATHYPSGHSLSTDQQLGWREPAVFGCIQIEPSVMRPIGLRLNSPGHSCPVLEELARFLGERRGSPRKSNTSFSSAGGRHSSLF